MKFSIKRDEFRKALDVALLSVNTDEGVITASILFSKEPDGLAMWSTDRRCVSKLPLPVEEGTFFNGPSFTVPAKRLSQWLKNVKDDIVSVEHDEGGVRMQCGKAKGHFVSLDTDAFPDYREKLEGGRLLFEADPSALADALRLTGPFIGDSTTNNMTANNLQVAELHACRMLSVNSNIISMFSMAENTIRQGDDAEAFLKVTKDEIRSLVSFLDQTCNEVVKVYKTSLYVLRSDDGSIFAYAESAFKLPTVSSLPLGLDEGEIWVLDKDELKSAVGALTATADKNDKVLTISCAGEAENGVLTLSMKDAVEKHDSVVQIPVKRELSEQDSVEFRINYEFLLKPLPLIGEDTVRIGVSVGAIKAPYLKMYQETDEGHTKQCLVTLRVR